MTHPKKRLPWKPPIYGLAIAVLLYLRSHIAGAEEDAPTLRMWIQTSIDVRIEEFAAQKNEPSRLR